MNRNMLLNDEMIKKIIESKEFFYQKLKDYFQSYMKFDISDRELNELLNIVENKRPFSFKELIEQDYKYKDILELIGKMISIFDANGYNKNIWNPYDDKRVIAKANVRQNIWTKNLIVYKLTKDITKLSSDSVKNAILYIQNPKMNLTQLSEEHRRETSKKLLKNEYNPDKYFEDIKNYFKDIFEDIKLNNDDNMGLLLSYIIYSDKFKDIWNEEKKEDFNIDTNKVITMKTKNIMLYGAPGVGKTHNYKKLVSLIESGKYNESDIFKSIIENQKLDIDIDKTFEIIKNEKRIEFVTFHQSYSYEDFIEGFRPSEEDEKIVRQDGIFKIISDRAKKNLENSQIPKQEYKIDMEELIQKFTNYVQDSLDNEKEFFIDKKVTIKGINDNNAFLLGGSITSPQRLTPDIIKRDYIEFRNGNIKSYEDVKPTYESQRNFHGNARYYFMIYNKIAEFEKTLNINTIQKQSEEQKNFYIVIDEINRGNISKIFGELITLIEEDKRGKKEYEVTLPYSKKPFLIPENLYIIATMNSTDKSIATIDIALRRRFTFLKMKPKEELVKNENAKALMNELNEHIKKTIGKDYQLGHSYFMKIENENDLLFVKEYKIKPLLEEYFYGDEDNYNKALKILGHEDESNKQ
ncbi:AAA family ATPase [Aliarcobacter butzleri]|uniref:McrB family protein n=1 Tax=Aliarcobacter butzleri TaxID=28197 RepID=UPI001ED9F305|nr:AAA family ATPase [Aliarcobacter butzleri]MCG3701842.1 AAA family ATPase [Aliarcobacter butzleri]